MRIATLILVALVGTVGFAAIETEQVPLQDIKGDHWTLEFKYRVPQRVVIANADGTKQAFWALPYTLINPNAVAHDFVPKAVLLSNTNKAASDGVYPLVVAEIKKRYSLKVLKNSVEMTGPVKAGPDEALDGVFVFPEVDAAMTGFTIFVGGLSGEFIVRDFPGKAGEPAQSVVLRKTRQLKYDFPGTIKENAPGQVYLSGDMWMWR